MEFLPCSHHFKLFNTSFSDLSFELFYLLPSLLIIKWHKKMLNHFDIFLTRKTFTESFRRKFTTREYKRTKPIWSGPSGSISYTPTSEISTTTARSTRIVTRIVVLGLDFQK